MIATPHSNTDRLSSIFPSLFLLRVSLFLSFLPQILLLILVLSFLRRSSNCMTCEPVRVGVVSNGFSFFFFFPFFFLFWFVLLFSGSEVCSKRKFPRKFASDTCVCIILLSVRLIDLFLSFYGFYSKEKKMVMHAIKKEKYIFFSLLSFRFYNF